MQAKKIWMVNQYTSTPEIGMGGRTYYLSKYMAEQGHDVKLIGSSFNHVLRKPKEQKELFEVEKVDKFDFVTIKMDKYKHAHDKKRVLNWFKFSYYLTRLTEVISEKPDVIVVSSPSLVSFLGAWRLARKTKAKLVFEVRDIWPDTLIQVGGFSRSHPFIRFLSWVEKKAYSQSDFVISNLKYFNRYLEEKKKSYKEFIWSSNGFDSSEVSVPEALPETVSSLIPEGKFVIGYTGAIGLCNNLDYLIDAAESLKDAEQFHFVIVGDGSHKEHLVTKANEKKLANVTFIDPIPKKQIQSMLQRFNACYIGLSQEPLFKYGVSPNKLFDYLVSGRPIIYAIESGDFKL